MEQDSLRLEQEEKKNLIFLWQACIPAFESRHIVWIMDIMWIECPRVIGRMKCVYFTTTKLYPSPTFRHLFINRYKNQGKGLIICSLRMCTHIKLDQKSFIHYVRVLMDRPHSVTIFFWEAENFELIYKMDVYTNQIINPNIRAAVDI